MPTIRRCCIVGCMSNSRLNPNLQFFQFPRPDNPFYKLWTQACQASLSRILPFKKPVLCALHFHPHCIGGRRLTSTAIPTLKLEVPTNLKAVEQQAMVEEIERSRKCAYINAVVYEWLVRANLNPQLRGSITHGMIKEKAETAKQIIGCETFMADNRWLNRFRESHLAGFAQKLASNQLKPMGPSLWIPDIVQELQHLFPPTNADRVENFENVPDEYINYMKQYGEYEEDDDNEREQTSPPANGYGEQEHAYSDSKMAAQSYYQQHQHQQQQHHGYYQSPPPPHHQHMSPPPPHPVNGYNLYGHHPGYNGGYHDYYNERQLPPPPHHYPGPPPFNGHHPGMLPHAAMSPPQLAHPPQRPMSHTPPHTIRPLSHSPLQREQTRPMSQSSSSESQHRSPVRNTESMQIDRSASNSPNKRRYSEEENGDSNDRDRISSKRSSPISQNDQKSRTPSPITEDRNNNDSFKIKLPLLNGKSGSSPNPSTRDNSKSRSNSPKSESNKETVTNGIKKTVSPTPSSVGTHTKELETYAQALEYLKPLEDFALFKENFRAIGLISQLENILQKGNRLKSCAVAK